MTEAWTARFSERQTTALDLLESPGVEELLYGGAKGGGKSVAGCQWLYLECRRIIERFGLEDREHPITVAFMGRKRATDFAKTTFETWKRFIPANGYEIREQVREVIIGNVVKIDYGGLDDTTAVSKFNSAEYARIFLDQAEEISPDDIAQLRVLGRLKINGQPVGAKLLLTANPVLDSWLLEFVDPARRGPHQRFVKALPADNPWLEPDYIDRLKRTFKDQPDSLRAYLEGQWEPPDPYDSMMSLAEARLLTDLFLWELDLAGTQPPIAIAGRPFKVDPSKIRPRPPGPPIAEVWPRLWEANLVIRHAAGRDVPEGWLNLGRFENRGAGK